MDGVITKLYSGFVAKLQSSGFADKHETFFLCLFEGSGGYGNNIRDDVRDGTRGCFKSYRFSRGDDIRVVNRSDITVVREDVGTVAGVGNVTGEDVGVVVQANNVTRDVGFCSFLKVFL